MELGIIVVILGLLIAFGNKIRDMIFKVKDEKLTKEIEKNQNLGVKLKTELENLNKDLNKPTQDLTPQQVEDFWSKK